MLPLTGSGGPPRGPASCRNSPCPSGPFGARGIPRGPCDGCAEGSGAWAGPLPRGTCRSWRPGSPPVMPSAGAFRRVRRPRPLRLFPPAPFLPLFRPSRPSPVRGPPALLPFPGLFGPLPALSGPSRPSRPSPDRPPGGHHRAASPARRLGGVSGRAGAAARGAGPAACEGPDRAVPGRPGGCTAGVRRCRRNRESDGVPQPLPCRAHPPERGTSPATRCATGRTPSARRSRRRRSPLRRQRVHPDGTRTVLPPERIVPNVSGRAFGPWPHCVSVGRRIVALA